MANRKKGYKLHIGAEHFQRKWYTPIAGRRPKREGTQRHYPSSLIDLIQVEGSCWVWRGTVGTLGNPIYKGWLSARRVVFEHFCRKLEEGEFIYGRIKTCYDTRCVCPWHQRISRKKMSDKSQWIPPGHRPLKSKQADIGELEFLDRLAETGSGLMLLDLPFPVAQQLINVGYLRAVPIGENRAKLEITAEGWAMIGTRRRMRRERGG